MMSILDAYFWLGKSAEHALDLLEPVEAIDTQIQWETAVRRSQTSNTATPLDIPGAAAFAVPLSGSTKSVVFQKTLDAKGLRLEIVDVVPVSPSALAQAQRNHWMVC